jgi:hypothetical protein
LYIDQNLAYLIGVFFGFLLDEEKLYDVASYLRNMFIRWILKGVVCTTMFLTAFATYWLYKGALPLTSYANPTDSDKEWIDNGGWGRNFTIAYIVVSRPLWCICLAFGLSLSIFGYGGLVRRFLSAQVWVPLARLTYGAYLWHNVIMDVFNASRVVPG